MKWLLILALTLSSFVSQATPLEVDQDRIRKSDDWTSFKALMIEAEDYENTIGLSYLVSGALVTMGGLYAAGRTEDSTGKLVFGLTASLGVWGMAYGAEKVWLGNPYHSFYQALNRTNLTEAQRNQLVRVYLEEERERQKIYRRIQMATHFMLAAVNAYSANKETDPTAKTFFNFFAGMNLALGIAYTF